MHRVPALFVALIALVLLSSMPVFAQRAATGAVGITVVACPDGIDPRTTSGQCSETRNLPRETRISYPGTDGQTDVWVKSLDHASVDGDTWLVEHLPANVPLTLFGVEPTEYTFFHVDGAAPADDHGWATTFTLAPGEQHTITVYVWNDAEGPITPSRNELVVRTFGCPEGVDPQVDVTPCTTPIVAPEGLTIGAVSRGEDVMPGPILAYETDDGTYTWERLSTYTMVSVSFHDGYDTGYGAPMVVGTDATFNETYYLAHLVRGEVREVALYFPLVSEATPVG